MRWLSSPEPLEARLSPAILLPSGNAVTYFDGDGDLVTIRTTKGKFADPSEPGQSQFLFAPTESGVGEQLLFLDLSNSPAFDGASLTISAVPFDQNNDGKPEGDGLVNVGYIHARDFTLNRGVDLRSVLVRGDLGGITAGDNFTDPALGTLNVLSLGALGLSTGAPTLFSEFLGPVGAIKIAGDVVGASIGAFGTAQGGQALGKIGSVTIGGGLFGGAGENTGSIYAAGTLGPVKIGGGIYGGSGDFSGLIQSGISVASVNVDGLIVGGDGELSGSIFAATSLGKLTIEGSLIGGAGLDSARVVAQKIGTVKIGGSIIGGDQVDETLTAGDSGAIYAFAPTMWTPIAGAGTIGAITIGGALVGGTGEGSGSITGEVSLAGVTIDGSLEGGAGIFSGSISTAKSGPIKIFGRIGGGSGEFSGAILAGKQAKSVMIDGPLVGGAGEGSGTISIGGNAGPIRISGAVLGGAGNFSGGIYNNNAGTFSNISIGGTMEGGTGENSGGIYLGGSVKTLTIRGSLFGGPASGSGTIRVAETLGSVTIGANLVGGATNDTALFDSGYIVAKRIGTATVIGSIFSGEVFDPSGTLVNSGAIRADWDIGTLTVRGSLIGSSTNPVIISAGGMEKLGATDLAMKTIKINGGVFNSKIVAGYSSDTSVSYLGLPVNADAQIGTVTVGGDWIASDLIAGIDAGADLYFGDETDTKLSGLGVRDRDGIISKISSIVIGGRVLGTPGAADEFHCGIGAEQVGSLKVGGTSVIPLLIGQKNDTFASGNAYPLGGTTTNAATVGDGFDMHVYEV